jgi:hypothetical protein
MAKTGNLAALERAWHMRLKIDGAEFGKDKEKEDKLKEEGKLKELLEKKEKELLDSKGAIKKARVEAAMARADMVDPDLVDLLFKSIEFDESNQPTNLNEVIAEWKEKKPWAFKQPEPDLKAGTNNAGASWKPSGKIFTTSDLQSMTPEERKQNRAEIDRQFAAGLLK